MATVFRAGRKIDSRPDNTGGRTATEREMLYLVRFQSRIDPEIICPTGEVMV